MDPKIIKEALLLYENNTKILKICEILKTTHPRYSKSKIDTFVPACIEMCKSFMTSVDKAGGSGWSIEDLSKMTVIELFCSISTNNIRFIYTKEKK